MSVDRGATFQAASPIVPPPTWRQAEVVDMEAVRSLFREYQEFLGIDLCFQGFENELGLLPAPYVTIELAFVSDRLAGCAALKSLGAAVCELKRLYVRPEFRNLGLGRALCELTIKQARKQGYRTMRLDTLARLRSAVRLYRDLGFVEIEPYYDNPLDEEVLYFERCLQSAL